MSEKRFIEGEYCAKVLFLGSSRDSFAFHKNVAETVRSLPKLSLLYAQNALQALEVFQANKVDVLVVDEQLQPELDIICDKIKPFDFPVLVRSTDASKKNCEISESLKEEIFKDPNKFCFVPKSDNIAAVHRTLIVANDLGCKKH